MFENLLRPGRINSMRTRHRLMVAPMEKSMAHPDGSLSERYIEYVAERVRGGASLINLESTYVDEGGRGNPYQVGSHHDGVIPQLRRLADLVHAGGGQLSLELHHGGRQSSSSASGRQAIAPSAIASRAMGPGATPREMTLEDIHDVERAYRSAARRCLEAGVDMITLHGAHGYLLGQFLSPQSNRRADEYGGSLENRARFPLQILEAVREVVGADYPIAYRISAVEYVDGGLELDESVEFSRMLKDAGIDMIDVAGGTYESMSVIFQGADAPRGGFLPQAAAIKAAVGELPVGVAQKLSDPVVAEQAMLEYGIDYITIARGFHADPHLVRKIEREAADDILPCIACNACLWMSVARTPVQCAANPHSNHEESRRMTPTETPRRVLVVGGGVGGMHAARVLARTGNEVTLVERETRLGGQILNSMATQPDHALLVGWLERQLKKHRVDVRLSTTADAELVAQLAPDAVVVATGAGGTLPRVRLNDGSVRMLDVFEAFAEHETVEGPVVVTTGDSASCHLALLLARRGVEVHLVEQGTALAADRPAPLGSFIEAKVVAVDKITVHRLSTVEDIDARSIVTQVDGARLAVEAATVVVGGRRSLWELGARLKADMPGIPVHVIGDAAAPRDVYWASHEAAEAAFSIQSASGTPTPTTGKTHQHEQ
ncbi:FAD-dependent oxidoreductase [Ruicaihuangia caeni]|uniref:FAD-dependent oxidoreductase n=1 Tax=Ruicaihuangia caeni TaxID=3042517 RepID=A0AAW6T1V4_9MICO|nr:FAD-dependent oxidoreductase [Klugiella sp. YN-L-19]MDI2097394.1 FAD-dependent oxidoreductase [Klugiella sp. YN-L-19]